MHWKESKESNCLEDEENEDEEDTIIEDGGGVPSNLLLSMSLGILLCSTLLAMTIDRVCNNLHLKDNLNS